MSNKKENTLNIQKKQKIVSFIAVFFVLGLVAYVALYKYEQHQTISALQVRQNPQEIFNIVEFAPQSSSTSSSQAATPQMPMTSVNSDGTAPKLQEGAMLPSNVPPEMLKALEARGMSVEDLQNAGQGTGAMAGMGSDQNSSTGMGGASQFPEAMQKALAERNGQQGQNSAINTTSSTGIKIGNEEVPSFVVGAIRHIEGHHSQEELSLLKNGLEQLTVNANDVNALMNIAGLFANHNEMQAAQYLAEKASLFEPNNPDIAYVYGVLLNKNFNNEEAVKQWEHALTLRDDAKLRLDLARIYRYQLAKADLAKAHLEKALTMPNLDSSLSAQIKKELEL